MNNNGLFIETDFLKTYSCNRCLFVSHLVYVTFPFNVTMYGPVSPLDKTNIRFPNKLCIANFSFDGRKFQIYDPLAV